jgi:hypothetical protein
MRSVPIAWLPRFRLTRGRSFALIACLVVLATTLIGWCASPPIVIRSDYGHDFHAIYEGIADHLKAGAPLYDLAAIAANPLDALYKYPPSFALVFWPFAQPDFVPALYAWRIVNGLLLIIAVWALLRAYSGEQNA